MTDRAELFTVREGELHLHFHPGQRQAWNSAKPFVFILAGRQSGKTSFAPWWLYREVLRTARSGEDNDYLAVSATNDLFDNAFLPSMLRVFCNVLDIGYYWVARRTIELKCLDPADPKYGEFYQGERGSSAGLKWGRIVLRSAQSEHSLESMAAKACLLDECGQPAFTVQDWEAVQGRTAIARGYGGGRILGTTTPYELGWLYENIFIPWTNGNPDLDVIQFPSYWNPNFSREEYERQKATMPEWRAAMFLDGKFERPAGLIYRDFDEATMVVREPFDIPQHWERVVGVDFGGANVATLWLALNPDDGCWYAYHETLMGHMPTPEHAAMAIAGAENIERITAIGGAKSEGQHRDDWWMAGFYIEEPPVTDVEVGIARGISLIKKGNLRVFPHLERLRREFRNYRRKLDAGNEPTEQIVAKNKFHMLDAYRYAATWIEEEPIGVDAMSYADYLKTQEVEHEPAFA